MSKNELTNNRKQSVINVRIAREWGPSALADATIAKPSRHCVIN